MDYVVFGMGYGATLMLLGWALRTFGPALRYRDDSDAPLGAGMMMARHAWQRFAAALGAVVATSGMALVLITFIIIIFINPGDTLGSRIAWVGFALILVAVAAWMWFYVVQYGVRGILPERQEPTAVFRSQPPSRAVPASAPITPREPVEPALEVDKSTDESDQSQDENWYEEDEEYADEQESRFAKYQLHHPEDQDETEAIDEFVDQDEAVESPERLEGVHETYTLDAEDQDFMDSEEVEFVESTSIEDAESDRPRDPGLASETSSETVDDETAEMEPQDAAAPNWHEPTIEEPEVSDAERSSGAGEQPEPDVRILSEDGDVAQGHDDATGFTVTFDEFADPETIPEEDTSLEASRPLSDTPEGRAEALRRIQEWKPEGPLSDPDENLNPKEDENS